MIIFNSLHIEWQILVLATVSEILGTASGLGSSIIFLPLAQYFEPPHLVMVLTSILHVFANSTRVYFFWNRDSFLVLKKLAPVFFFSTGAGALLAVWTTPPFHKLALGILILVFSVFRLLSQERVVAFVSQKQRWVIAMAGLSTGWVGTGGAIRSIALTSLNLTKYEFIFVSSGIDLGGDALRTLIYVYNSFLEIEHIFYVPALAVCAWIGSFLGRLVVKKVSQVIFERTVIFVIIAIGITTITQFFTE